jgi:hypothetical protein
VIAARLRAGGMRVFTRGRRERRDWRDPTAASTTRRVLPTSTTNTRPLTRTLPTRTPPARSEDKSRPATCVRCATYIASTRLVEPHVANVGVSDTPRALDPCATT